MYHLRQTLKGYGWEDRREIVGRRLYSIGLINATMYELYVSGRMHECDFDKTVQKYIKKYKGGLLV